LKQIAYSLHGGGDPAQGNPPLVLIHGAGGSRLSWPANIRRLEGRRVYAVDLPGHGGSPNAGRDSVERYLQSLLEWQDEVKEQSFIWVGHSMGGAIALQAALQASQRVSGLILVGSGAHLPVNPRLLKLASRPESLRQLVNLIIAWAFGPEAPAGLIELSRQRMAETRPDVIHQDFLASSGFDIGDRISEIRVPTLVICGLDDRLTPELLSRELATGIEGAILEFIIGAGHMVMLEKPDKVAQAIERFLESSDF
jgi:pimeloyl-ACP methyl ester carboxylesterase